MILGLCDGHRTLLYSIHIWRNYCHLRELQLLPMLPFAQTQRHLALFGRLHLYSMVNFDATFLSHCRANSIHRSKHLWPFEVMQMIGWLLHRMNRHIPKEGYYSCSYL